MQSNLSANVSNQMDVVKKCIAKDIGADALSALVNSIGATQQGNPMDAVDVSPFQDFEARVKSLIHRTNSSVALNPQDATARPEQHRMVDECYMEIVKVTEQLSQIEKVAEQTRGCDAVSTDAKKWQELTSVALDWSRKSLCEQQHTAIFKLSQHLKQNLDAPQHVPPTPSAAAPAHKSTSQAATTKTTPSGFEEGETLRTHLETLGNEDPNRILIVRRINRLGFDSPMHLENAFAEVGTVTRVFVAHSRVKPTQKRPVPRVRPAGLGFVLMENAEDALRIASNGPEMMINNVNVEVNLYQPGTMSEKGQDEVAE